MRSPCGALLGVLLAALAPALLAAAPSPARAARPDGVEVRAGFDTDDALLGDTVGFTVLVTGTDEVEGPAESAFGFDFDVRFLGGRPSRRASIVTVNGRTQRSEEISYALMYELRPRRAGDLRVPPLVLRTGGEELRTPERVLRVIGPRKTRFASLALSYSPRRVYVEQPFDLILRVTVQRAQMPGGWYEGDPWLSGRPPQLRIPWFGGLDGFLTGDFDEFRRRLLAPGGGNGFLINGQSQSSLFGDTRALRFELPRTSVIRGGRAFHVYTLRKTFVPLRSGTNVLPLATVTGELATVLAPARGQLEVKESETVFVAHDPVTIDVLPVPEAGRPPTYSHAVGRFEVSAEVRPTRVKVGDPMTLTMRVRGSGQLDLVDAPNLAAQEGLGDDFQVAEADPPHTADGQRVFTFLLRPLHAGVTAIPPLEFAAFEPESEEFRVVRTAAIPVTVEESRAVQASEVVVSGGAAGAQSSPGEELHGGLLGNYADEDCLADETFDPGASPLVWLLLIAPPLVCGGSYVARRRREALAADPAGRRARGALARATTQIAAGREASARGDLVAAAGRLHDALAGYVADRTNRPAGGMTAADAERLLAAAGAQIPEGAALVAALREAEAARFGGSAAGVAAALDAAPAWLRALDRERLT